ncbi:glycosyl transferase [Limnospira fusiformis CCALA 023]
MITIWVGFTLGLIAFCLAIPIMVLFVECLAAGFNFPGFTSNDDLPEPTISVLIPAHNEGLVIGQTLANILPQLKPDDEIIVIADNCTDETVAIATENGAQVLERQDPDNRGKGYALDYGLHHLAQNPPEVVVMIDADCLVEPGAIATIAQQALLTAKPVQALYLMETPPNPSVKNSISALAFLVKNWVRPQGLAKLGGPCLLTGTGMAFPWSIIQSISLASSNIVEDMQLGVDLAIAGYSPQFTAKAKVIGYLPQDETATTSQRTRWEHGHLQTLKTQGPRLLKASLSPRRFELLQMALDLCVPPLSLLVILWVGAAAISLLASSLGVSAIPTIIIALEGVLLIAAIGMAWANFGRSLIPLKTLLGIPLYILWKIPLYLTYFIKPQKEWVRTQREPLDKSSPNSDKIL